MIIFFFQESLLNNVSRELNHASWFEIESLIIFFPLNMWDAAHSTHHEW